MGTPSAVRTERITVSQEQHADGAGDRGAAESLDLLEMIRIALRRQFEGREAHGSSQDDVS
jgi:hypothetical protein